MLAVVPYLQVEPSMGLTCKPVRVGCKGQAEDVGSPSRQELSHIEEVRSQTQAGRLALAAREAVGTWACSVAGLHLGRTGSHTEGSEVGTLGLHGRGWCGSFL